MVANLTTRLGQLTSSPAGGPYTGANKIINGDMVIDQRNAGASVTFTNANDTFNVDRWINQTNVAPTKLIATQASAGGLTGLSTGNGFASQSNYSVGAGEYFLTSQKIEGLNCQDLLWGTASAKTITVSFWVYSSLTGLHGGVVSNAAQDRTYPYSYTINAVNTWEYKTVTIAGDTSGTWLTTNGIGLHLRFSLGTGATYKGTAGAWAAATYFSCTGEVSTVATNGAVWFVTGVKLEVGSIATPFVPDDYQVSLGKCQRYYRKIIYAASSWWGAGAAWGTGNAGSGMTWSPTMRAAPTVTLPSTINWDNTTGGAIASVTTTATVIGLDNFRLSGTAASGWVAGNATLIEFTGNLVMDAEL